jgi:hypothetical protein
MSRPTALDDLKSFLSHCRDIDSIWIRHIFNLEIKNERDNVQADIEYLNRLNKISDIKKEILTELQYENERVIDRFRTCLEIHQANILTPTIDLKNIDNNQRFILFANHIMEQNLRDRRLKNINNPTYKFYYMLFLDKEYYRSPQSLERIYKRFSNTYAKYNTHFKFADNEFYIWANKYISENEEYRGVRTPVINSTDFEKNINAIFDQLYDQDKNIHYALRKKISNAWYQKKHREEKKVKKPGFYALTIRAKEALATLSRKNNLSEDNMLEQLIDRAYVQECLTPTGEPLY